MSSTPTRAAQPIPVIVLTGFLGSGKTTLLNRLLRDPAWANSAVVVNEFGDIGLDHLLVASARDNIVLMDAGCLCCQVLDSLPQTLADLIHRQAGGEVPPFQRVLVETSGLAEPAPILRTLMRDPIISHFYRLQGLVCVVDGLFGEDTLAKEHEAETQVQLADRLIVTKTDITPADRVAALRGVLQAMNPHARIVTSAELEVGDLFGTASGAAPWLDPVAVDAHDHHHAHEGGVASVSLMSDKPVTWPGLAQWIDGLKARYGPRLLRTKGIINLDGGPVVLHGVQNQFDTRRLPAWPDDERRSRIVLIGHDLDAGQLALSLSDLNGMNA
jgi:G3E family GTPase